MTRYRCDDPECWCCNPDEQIKNEDQDMADKDRRGAKKAERKAERKAKRKKRV